MEEPPQPPQGGVQRRVLESFLAFLEDEGYVITQRDHDQEWSEEARRTWVEEFFARAKQEGW